MASSASSVRISLGFHQMERRMVPEGCPAENIHEIEKYWGK